MKTLVVSVLDDSINCPVIQFPNRSFPSIAIQGDSLKILYRRAAELQANLNGEDESDNPVDLASELTEMLKNYVGIYIDALAKNKIDTSFLSE